jgi:hypothetical protein
MTRPQIVRNVQRQSQNTSAEKIFVVGTIARIVTIVDKNSTFIVFCAVCPGDSAGTLRSEIGRIRVVRSQFVNKIQILNGKVPVRIEAGFALLVGRLDTSRCFRINS